MNQEQVLLALEVQFFAAEAHKYQKRKVDGNPPFFNHPLGVAKKIVTIGKVFDVNVYCAALLHDAIEDTKVTYEEIKEKFGETIADLVREVTDNKALTKVERKKRQIEHAGEISVGAKLIKLSDKLDNLSDLLENPIWSREICYGYFVWASHCIDQMRGTNEGLEAALDEVLKAGLSKYGNGVIQDGDLEVYYSLL